MLSFLQPKLKEKVLKKPFLKDAALLLLLQIVSQINNLIATFFVARFLGPANMGTISFTQTYISLTFFINGGIDSYYMWQLANNPEKRNEILSRCFTTKVITNLFSFTLGCLGVFFFSHSFIETIILTYSLLLGFIVYNIGFTATFLLTEKKVKDFFSIAISTSFVIFFLRIFFVYIEASIHYFILTLLTESLILVFFGQFGKKINLYELLLYKKNILKETFFELKKAKTHISTVAASFVFTRIDQFFIKSYLTTYDLGIYTSSVRLVEYPMILSNILTTLLIPRVSQSNNQSERKKNALLSIFIYMTLAIIVTLFYFYFSEKIIYFIYGGKFADAVPLLAIYCLAIPGMWLHANMSVILAAYNKMHISLIVCVISGFLSIIILHKLVPSLGIYGAAYTAVFIQTITGIMSFFAVLFFSKKIILDTILKNKIVAILKNVNEKPYV